MREDKILNFNYERKKWDNLAKLDHNDLEKSFNQNKNVIVLPDKNGWNDLILIKKDNLNKLLNIYYNENNIYIVKFKKILQEMLNEINLLNRHHKQNKHIKNLVKLLKEKIQLPHAYLLTYTQPQHQVNPPLNQKK